MSRTYLTDLDFDEDSYGDAELLADAEDLLGSHSSELALEHSDFLRSLATYELPDRDVPIGMADQIRRRAERVSEARRGEQQLVSYLMRHPDGRVRQLGQKQAHCHQHAEIYAETDELGQVLDDGRLTFMWNHHCRERRTCPHEARAAAKKFSDEVVRSAQLVKHAWPGSSVQYWVVSPPNVPAGDLADQMRAHARELGALLSKLCAREDLLAAFVICEYPLAKDRQSFNVHFNVLAVTKNRWSCRWGQVREALGWHCYFKHERELIRITTERLKRQGKWRPDLTFGEILSTAMKEVVKYSAKMTGAPDKRHGIEDLDPDDPRVVDVDDAPPLTAYPPDAFLEWWLAGSGFRRARTYGLLNAQRKLKHRDFEVCPRLRPYRNWTFDASARVQGARIKAARERAGLSREELAAAAARVDGGESFRWLGRLMRLEPRSDRKGTQESACEPLSDEEAATLSRVLGGTPEALTRLQGASVPDIMRKLLVEPPWRGRARVGAVRWWFREEEHRALFLIQAHKYDRTSRPELDERGPRAPPRGPGPPGGARRRDAAAAESATNSTITDRPTAADVFAAREAAGIWSDSSGQWD